MKATIQKTTFVVTILHYADDAPTGHESMEQVAREMEDGAWIGQFELKRTVGVHPRRVNLELLELGNDGSFFGKLK